MKSRSNRRPAALAATCLAIALACAAGGTSADFEKGLEAAKRRDFETAIAELLPEAQAGNPDAQVLVANMYRRGYGVPRDYAEAARWYRAAADQGVASAMYNYAVHLREGLGVESDPAAATEWFGRSARLEYPPAMLNYGLRLFSGRGVAPDRVLGYAWVSKAAGKGSIPAVRRRRALESELDPEEAERGRRLSFDLP